MDNREMENSEMVIFENGVDIAGNAIAEMNDDACDNFITFAPNITINRV